jgi:hypothetical protein
VLTVNLPLLTTPLHRARYHIFNAQESLNSLVYNCLAIWKAVAIGACLQGPWRGRHFWGGNFAAVTGYRPGRRGLRGRVRFHSGEISPRQFHEPNRPSRLSESPRSYSDKLGFLKKARKFAFLWHSCSRVTETERRGNGFRGRPGQSG